MKKCLSCYELLDSKATQDYHEKCSKRIFGSLKAPLLDYDMAEINDLAKAVLNQRLTIPGVQPKLSLVLDKTDKISHGRRLTIVGLWDGTYILKPTNPGFKELPENEDLTMHMAESCGMKTAIHSLIKFRSGELAYIAKRFDRQAKGRNIIKLHQEDMCQLTGLLTENKYNSSMEKVSKAVGQYTTNKGLELLNLFQVTVFSFLTGNSDMHLKNFSLIKKDTGLVEMTPAYDLLATQLVVPEDQEELALAMNGKKNKITRKDFDSFATYCGIPSKAAENVISDFEKNLSSMKAWISKSFLSKEMKKRYLLMIKERSKILKINLPTDFHT